MFYDKAVKLYIGNYILAFYFNTIIYSAKVDVLKKESFFDSNEINNNEIKNMK